MNLVKGVADLLRRSSGGGQSGESASSSPGQRFSPPAPKILFSESGDEAILHTLWERYDKATDKESMIQYLNKLDKRDQDEKKAKVVLNSEYGIKLSMLLLDLGILMYPINYSSLCNSVPRAGVDFFKYHHSVGRPLLTFHQVEKKRLFHVFLKQFLQVYKNWEPVNSGILSEDLPTAIQSTEYPNDVVIGCSAGHPTEITLSMIEEVRQLTVQVTDGPTSINITSQGLAVLDAITILTRSIHNCKILGYYGGIQKLTALMKGAVVQLKTMSGAVSGDESLPDLVAAKLRLLQQILFHVVSIICSFIDFNSTLDLPGQMHSNTTDFCVPTNDLSDSLSSLKVPFAEIKLQWRQKAVVSVMEAGGLNWLVELLRIVRRLSIKEQQTDIALHYLTLRTLHLALSENPRGQSHFKSIGGLDVLLDGFGILSNNLPNQKSICYADDKRDGNPFFRILQLHILYLEVLRVAVFGNINNLQFLCENGRIHKFANSFCSPAFVLQELIQWTKDLNMQDDLTGDSVIEPLVSSPSSASASQVWNNYVAKLSKVLCSFILAPEDIKTHHVQVPAGRILMASSLVYSSLSIKWFLRVLLIVFPCTKACPNGNELVGHIRVFVGTLQCAALDAFRNVLVMSPSSLDVLREEGVWELIFSENFFYFGVASEELSEEQHSLIQTSPRKFDEYRVYSGSYDELKTTGLKLQMKVISFVEFAATSAGSSNNLPELSVLLDALEQTACNPQTSGVLAKTLLRILQLSAEKTVASMKTLNGVLRLLKVACIQAKEYRSGDTSPLVVQSSNSYEVEKTWISCVETSLEFLSVYLAIADDARRSVLISSECIDCLFELFWEERLRDHVMKYIMELMKIVPVSEEDERAKMQLCSKYLEAFNQIKEREERFTNLSINLLLGMKDMLSADRVYYQSLFRDGECFLHVVSLLNGNLDEVNGEKLVLHVLETLTLLLTDNDTSKAAFRSLVGKGYKTLQNLLLDFCQQNPSEELLNSLLDMLVDGNFDIKASPIIKNEDVIILYLSVLQKSSDSLRHHGLNLFQQLLKDSLSNRASCVRAGVLNFLLDWFPQEDNESIILKIAQLIQVIGGHSISGKDIRKIFAILRSEKVGAQQQYCSLLLTCVLSMLNEKGPTAFFDLSGNDSGIIIKTPLHWPLYKGFTLSCWLRVEDFPSCGTMGLFKCLTASGRGCFATLTKDKLFYESFNLKQQSVELNVNLATKKWHFLCVTHSVGRAFSGGSLVRCYLDGDLISSGRCRYPKVNEPITDCTVGTNINWPVIEGDTAPQSLKNTSGFYGQIGPVYMFNEAISSDQVQDIFSLGPSYMYSFLDNEAADLYENPLRSGILDSKEGLGSKILFGLSAQASNGRKLFNVSSVLDSVTSPFEANVMVGTQLCSRRLLQQIIYCVGGVSVFFPLVLHSDKYENEDGILKHVMITPITKEHLTAEVIELIASVLHDNLANQQQMHILSGFSILGFLLQSAPPQQLNMQALSALKHLYNVVANGSLAELLVKDAISCIFLNPLIWLYTSYKVQRELYMFLIQQFDNDPRLLDSLCRLPRVIDIVSQFYWDSAKSRFSIGSKPLLHPVSQQIIGERPGKEEVRKLRLLLLSLGEMSLRQNITVEDIKALTAFFETSQDTTCIEDVLHMVIRAISQKQLLASFLEQVNLIGGCHIFINLLQREFEPARLLSLQFIGRLLVGLPSERKGLRIFSLSSGRAKYLSETSKQISLKMQPFFSALSDRVFKFPQTDNLCATLFDVLLGGASPKQVLQKYNQLERQKDKDNSSHFVLPQMLGLIFRFLTGCEDASTRIKIIKDLIDLVESNPSNVEALMEHGWNAWLRASVELDILKNYKVNPLNESERYEQDLARGLYCLVLCHSIHSVKGGWQHLEETVNFLLVHCEQGGTSYRSLLRDIYEEILQRLIYLSSLENIFVAQPCRDNTLYLLKLVDEMLMAEINYKIPFPASCFGFSVDSLELENMRDSSSALFEILQRESDDQILRNPQACEKLVSNEDDVLDDKWWNLYDSLWVIISEINGKGASKSSKSSSTAGPSLGQRARGLVESLNIPAAEMAASVVSGGIGNALGGKQNKSVDKAMLLRGEKCPRIVFRLVILYLCKSSLERASRCVKQVTSLLSSLLAADDEQNKSRLQLFIGALVAVKSKYGMLDDGARFHVIAHLLREAVNCGKSVLATGIAGRDDSSDLGSNGKEIISISNLLQKDRVIAAAAEEAKYIKTCQSDRATQLHQLRVRMNEISSAEDYSKEGLEDEIQSGLNAIISSDESRRAAFRLAHEEQEQNVTEKWIHLYRSLIDERGPWSANPFPNKTIRHWKLDKTEDAWRRRQKLKQNYHFDEKLCCPSSTVPTSEASPTTDSIPNIVGNIPEQMKQFLLKGVRRITDEGSSEPSEDNTESSVQKSSIPLELAEKQLVKDTNDQKDIVPERKETSSLLDTESNEVLMLVKCVLVTPKRKLAGHLAVMKKFLHFFGEFLVEGTGGSSVFKNFRDTGNSDLLRPDDPKQNSCKWPMIIELESEKWGADSSIEVVSDSGEQKHVKHVKRHRRWKISKVKAVHWTRYLLRYTAIEIFFSDSTPPIFLNFSSQKEAKEVGSLVVATRNESLYPKGSSKDKNGVISFVDRRVALEMAETARESWRRREITNFEYLMILNTLAGRSYNDLTQYPVFPWVLADYSSEVLDFNKSTTFRDLSKPVGALDPKRFEVFQDRYRNFCDPDIPSFYYGSHYSSMGIVLYYLIRLEPFTSLHRSLQGGKFDHADRLFQSIESTYRNCLTNTSDVKELIPEFFYMPEFLVNSNSYHLGVKQDGEPIGDVCLPPWAKGSSEEFIRKNREALESEYVSSNLHHWIDLLFGYKQRGKPAVEAANIFYYLTYEDAVDLDTMDDDLQRSAIEDQIANFGQTPIQIFRKKHPRRGPPIPISHPLHYAPSSINLTSVVCSTSNPSSAVVYISVLESNIVIVNQGLTLSVKMWLTTQLQSGGNFTFSGSQEPFFGVGSDILTPRRIGSPLAENFELVPQCFATLQTSSENFLISCGNWENSFQVTSLGDGRRVQSIRHHKDVVSCLAVSSDGSIVATGSYDTTVMVWEVMQSRGSEKRARNTQTEFPRKDYVIVETPFHILCGHDDVITCLYVSAELDIVISGSKDGTCVFHTLREGRYVRSLSHPSGCALSKLAASRQGRIVFYSDDDLSLHLYSINGKHLTSSESNGRLNCMELSACGEFLVCAGDQGQIVVRSMNSLEVVGRYNGVGKVITSLTVTAEECFLAGTKDGNLLVYSIENPQHRKANVSRHIKTKGSATG